MSPLFSRTASSPTARSVCWEDASSADKVQSTVRPSITTWQVRGPTVMTVPLIVLAAGSFLVGWLGTPKLWGMSGWFRGFETWLEPAFASAAVEAVHEGAHDASIEWILMSVSVAVALMGIGIARWFYHKRPEIPDSLEARLRPLHSVLLNKWYVDELYDFLFVNGFAKGGGRVLGAFDRNVVDGGVNGAGVQQQMCASGQWQNSGACLDPDTCVDAAKLGEYDRQEHENEEIGVEQHLWASADGAASVPSRCAT